MSQSVRRSVVLMVLLGITAATCRLPAQDTAAVRLSHDSVSVRFVDTDLRAVIQALGRYLPKPVLTANVPGVRVTLETPAPVAREGVPTLLKGLVESQGLQFSEDSDFYRVGPKPPEPPARLSGGPPGGGAEGGGSAIQLHVIRLKHARAADVAATVNQLYGAGGEFSGHGGLSGGTLSDELRRNAIPPVGPSGAAQAAGASGRPAVLSGAITIVPDELTNALLVRASQEDFDLINGAVEQLDIRPLQVLIEVLVVEARHDRSFSLGTDIFLPQQKLNDGTLGGNSNGGASGSPGLGEMVIRLMDLGKSNLDATLRAAQSRGDVEIISRPVLLASNNTEASFLVGSQRPFVQVSRTQPTDGASRDQIVQYRDVGTKLTVKPTINTDGYVSLVVRQEINNATDEVAFGAPVISTREAQTQVFVRDSQTIVLGGLRDLQRSRTQSGVPILSSIPILGGLFGRASRSSNGTELFLFITPRILKTDADADAVTTPRMPAGEAR